ncbi:MAG: beta strand repeat-containing protein [Kiritimatiellia bacterium]
MVGLPSGFRALLLGAVSLAGLASAGAVTWTGAGENDDWSTAANWSGGTPVAGAALVFDGAARTSSMNDLTEGTVFGGISFAETAAPFTLAGNALGLSGALVNESGARQTLALPVVFAGNVTVTAAGGDIVHTAPVGTSATSKQDIRKNGPGAWVFAGEQEIANPHPDVYLENGTLRFAAGSRFSWTGPAAGDRFAFCVQPTAVNSRLGLVVEPGAEVVLPNITVFNTGNDKLAGSTFDLTVDGNLSFQGSDSTFGDQAGKAISVTVGPQGSLYASYANLGTRTPTTVTVNGGSFVAPNVALGRTDNASGGRTGNTTFNLVAGEVTVRNYFGTMSTGENVTNRLVLGSGSRGGATFSTCPLSRAGWAGSVFVSFNGAEVVARAAKQRADFFGGTDLKEVLEGGFVFRADFPVDIQGAVTHAESLGPDVLDGGIVKRGAEVLTFTDDVSVTGPIRVEEGRLSFAKTAPTTQSALYMAPGTTINLAANNSPDDVLTAPALTLGTATGRVYVYIDGEMRDGVARCDRIHIPAGGYVGRLQFTCYGESQAGGARPFAYTGDFPVITYTDTTPQLSDLAVNGLAAGYTGTFVRDAANKRILLRVTRSFVGTEWSQASGGAYETVENWTAGVPADDATSAATFGSALTADGVVSLADAHSLLNLTFANAVASYTLAGGSLVLGDPTGAEGGLLTVSAGSHTIASPVVVRGPVSSTRAAGTRLDLTGGLTGAAPLTLQGAGTTRLEAPDGAADFAGGVVLAAGNLELASANGVGTMPLTLKSNTTVKWLPEADVALAGLLTLSQTSTCEVVSSDATVTLDGTISFENQGTLFKRGPGTLFLTGDNTGAGDKGGVCVRAGKAVFSGANYTILSPAANRMALATMPEVEDSEVSIEVREGSDLTLSGFYLGGSGGKPARNLFRVDDSRISCSGEVTIGNAGGCSVEASLVNDARLSVNAMNVGVNGTNTLTISHATLDAVQITLGGYGTGFAGPGFVRGGSGVILVDDGGVLRVKTDFDWISDNAGAPSSLHVRTGGRAELPPSSRLTGSTGTATLHLDGGTFVCGAVAGRGAANDFLRGVDVFSLGAGGGTVDTDARDVVFRRAPTLAEGVETAAFVKAGAGALTLLDGVAPQLSLSVAGGVLALTNGAANAIAVAGIDLADETQLMLDAGDALTIAGALSVTGQATIRLRGVPAAGTHVLATAATLPDDVSSLRVVCDGSLDAGTTCSLVKDGTALKLVVTKVAEEAPHWTADADGNWQDAGNWSGSTVPSGAAAQAYVDAPFTAPRTLSLPAGGLTLGALVLAAPQEPTLMGGPLSLSALHVGGAGATLAAPLVPGAEPLSISLFGGATLTCAANVAAGALDVQGPGAFAVAATNAAVTIVQDGSAMRLVSAGRQTGSVTLDGGTLMAAGETNEVAGAVSLARSAAVGADHGSTLVLVNGASGTAPLRKVGGGAVLLPGGYDGDVVVTEGLLNMAGLPTGTLNLSGGTFETAVAGTLAALTGARDGELGAVVLNNASDITVVGDVSIPRAALVKRGAGTLTFSGPSLSIPNVFTGGNSSDINGFISFGEQGETPEGGCSALTVTEGTVVFDNPDATRTANLSVGRWTAHDTPAHAILRNGAFNSYIAIGRGHGGAGEGEPVEATVTIESGTVTCRGISIASKGERPDYRGRAVLTLAGGTLDVTSGEPMNIGEDRGAMGVYRQTGGESIFRGGNVKVGYKSPGGCAEILLEGGTMTIDAASLNLGVDAASTGTLYLATGASLACQSLQVGSGTGIVRFDGGTIRLRTGPVMGLQCFVEKGGAVIAVDSFRVTSHLRLQAGETAGGGLVKRGPGELRLAAPVTMPVDDYTGAVRLEEGAISVETARAPFPETATLETLEGTRLALSIENGGRNAVRVGTATINGELALRVGDRLDVTGSLVFGPQASVLVFQPTSATQPNLSPGSFTVCTYGGAAPDISRLAVTNPVDGFDYAFTAADGRVTLNITVPEGSAFDAVWDVDADGAWSTAANWQAGLPPVAAGTAGFHAAITEPRTITLEDDVVVTGLSFANTNAYTLAGSGTLTLDAGANGSATLQARQGTHRIEVPVTAQAPLHVSGNANVVLAGGASGEQILKEGDGRLTLGANSTVPVDLRAGVLDVSNGELAAPVAVGGGRFAADSAAGAITGPVRLMTDMTVSTTAPLLLAGDVSGAGTLTQSGGTLRLGAVNSRTGGTVLTGGRLELVGGTPGTGSFTYRGGTLASAGDAASAIPAPVTLEKDITIDAAGPLTLEQGLTSTQRRAYTKTGTGTLTLCGSTVNQPGYQGSFELNDGTLRLAEGAELVLPVTSADDAAGEAAVRYQFSLNSAAPARRGIILEKGSRLASGGWFLSASLPKEGGEQGVCDITINGGVMEALWGGYGFIIGDAAGARINVRMNGGEVRSLPNVYTDIGTRAPVEWTVDGGGVVRLGWTAFGRQAGEGAGRIGGGATIWVKDGLFDAGQMLSWQSTDDAAMTNIVRVGAGARAANAVFATVPTVRAGRRGHAEFVFDGGVLRATGVATNAPGTTRGNVANYLNGVNAVRIGPGGAGFETAAEITLPNDLLAQPEGDGGVYKMGSGRVTLSGSLASVTGAVEVLEGTLAATFVNTNDLAIAADGAFDLIEKEGVFGNVSGCGSVVNGTLQVVGTLAPGDAAGEIGTFHAENLSFARGATIRIDRDATAGDAFAVSGTLTLAGGGVLDFGHEEGDVVPIPFSGVLGTVGSVKGSLGGWRATGLGYPPSRRLAANLRVADGVVSYTVRDSGLVLIVR